MMVVAGVPAPGTPASARQLNAAGETLALNAAIFERLIAMHEKMMGK